MPRSFRQRMFLGLAALGTLPLAAALVVLALEIRATGAAGGPRASLDEIAASGARVIQSIDTTALSEPARAALSAHAASIARQTTQARRAELISRTWAGAFAVGILIVAALSIAGSLTLARRWSRYTSAPVEELVRWVRHIALREPLPATTGPASAPEFDALRQALRDMAAALERAQAQALENERLAAFRETARQVAHEMRGPLSAARLALGQVSDNPSNGATAMALRVLEDETSRLDRLAKEFAEFGRLPEGPKADVDLGELLDGVVAATVPADRPVMRRVTPGLFVHGHYEPLRRAFQNIMKNAVEAGGSIEVTADRADGAAVRVAITDGGPGVPADQRERIFEPYVTGKPAGTGLGLALVRQTVTAHGGSVRVEDGATCGARFVVTLPERT